MTRLAINRESLARSFPNDPRLVRAFEDQAQAVEDATTTFSDTQATTSALQDAFVLTLGENSVFTNERVFRVDLSSMGVVDDGKFYTVRAKVANKSRFNVELVPSGDATFFLPLSGVLVTRDSMDTLKNKTLDQPIFTLGSFADDAAAATGGVPVGGAYVASGAVRIRLS